MVATKFWEDCKHSNKFFAKLGGISLRLLNELEVELLELLDYNLLISDDMLHRYMKYFSWSYFLIIIIFEYIFALNYFKFKKKKWITKKEREDKERVLQQKDLKVKGMKREEEHNILLMEIFVDWQEEVELNVFHLILIQQRSK